MPQRDSTLNFLDVPLEVRRIIYPHAISNTDPEDSGDHLIPVMTESDKRQRKTVLALLLSCRQVHEEAEEALCSQCIFHLTTPLRLYLEGGGGSLGGRLTTRPHGNLKFMQRLAAAVDFEMFLMPESGELTFQRDLSYAMKLVEETDLEDIMKCAIKNLSNVRELQLTLNFDWIEWGPENTQLVANHLLTALKPIRGLKHFSLKVHSEMDKLSGTSYRQVMVSNMANFQALIKILSTEVPASENWPDVESDGVLI